MGWAAFSDVRTYTIPNWITVAALALYPAHVLASPAKVDWVGGITVAAIVLAAGFVLFALRWMGAGDAKLLTAAAIWAGPELIAQFLVVVAPVGGVLSIIVLIRRAKFMQVETAEGGSADQQSASLMRARVPYGVAVAAGAIFIAFRLFTA